MYPPRFSRRPSLRTDALRLQVCDGHTMMIKEKSIALCQYSLFLLSGQLDRCIFLLGRLQVTH